MRSVSYADFEYVIVLYQVTTQCSETRTELDSLSLEHKKNLPGFYNVG
jgi:hypothetical protein